MSALTGPAVAMLALAGAAMATNVAAQDRAQGPGPRGPDIAALFAAADANDDGQVTKAELAAYREAEFRAADTNADGKLSAEEISARHLARLAAQQAERTARMIRNRDTDGDGSLSLAEAGEGPLMRHFTRIDSNGDGAISLTEVEAREGHRGGHGQGNDRND